jgi:cell division protein FtsA
MIEPRMEEILALARREIRTNVYELTAGVVLTGGSSLMPGLVELAEQVLDLPVRRGTPVGVSGLVEAVGDPRQATGVGLVTYAYLMDVGEGGNGNGDGLLKGISGLKRWFSEVF